MVWPDCFVDITGSSRVSVKISTPRSTNLSLWEGDYSFGQKYLMSKPMAATTEVPEQEMEHTLEPEAENLSTHMERQARLMLERPTIHDLELSLEAGNVPEKLPSPSAECRPLTPPLPNGNQPEAEHKVAPKSAEVRNACSIGAEATPQVTGKGSLANRYLEKIGQLRGATEFSQGSRETCTLAEDVMSFDGSQKQPDRNKKEEFGELCTKLPGAAQFALKLQDCEHQDGQVRSFSGVRYQSSSSTPKTFPRFYFYSCFYFSF
ncbi:uncharacterized protein LOC119162228 isoform X2 [Rhipicephalus microplus]|uniref:uncharacterized protein LOC119162228 isoform X2 n=1 Tax=Rhipicephalus microplus TaxID=6941 RepID=UPI003F6C02CE